MKRPDKRLETKVFQGDTPPQVTDRAKTGPCCRPDRRRTVSAFSAFALAALLISGCAKQEQSSKTAQPLPVGPDQVFVDARFVVLENGLTNAIVRADSVKVYQERSISIAEGNLRVDFFSREGEQISTLNAARGIVYGMTQDIDSLRAEGNVVVVWNERKARMETPFIRWIFATRRIFADSAVVLSVENAVERGVGLEAPDDLKSYTMRQVSGTVTGQEIKIPGRGERSDSLAAP